jgi:pimeloyl-ACP methyl ester carboxylesterase
MRRWQAGALVRKVGFLLCLMLGAVTIAAAPAAGAYAPLNLPGPPLSVPAARLAAALSCQPSVRDARVTPVLLNPATGVTAAENYSWNWEPALTRLGIPWCAYTAPNDTLNDIATSGEYLVYAIRTMYALAHRRIDIMGHSQGGMSMRWPLRFWPDTRAMVKAVIGFSGSNHGTQMVTPGQCAALGCPPADWQQLYDSPFIEALNSGAETFARIAYTEIWTHTDEVVTPNGNASVASAALHTGAGAITNVATQQLCPADLDEHLMIGTVDPVAYAIAVDALTHPGPANLSRVVAENPHLCGRLLQPGVNPATVNTYLQLLAAAPSLLSVELTPLAGVVSGAPVLHSPPPLPCYVFATCTGAAAPQLLLATRRRGAELVVTVTAREGTQRLPVPDVTVSVGRQRRITGPGGRAGFRLGPGRVVVRAFRAGCDGASARLRRG